MKPLTLQTLRASPEVRQVLKNLRPKGRAHHSLQQEHLSQLSQGHWLAAEKRGCDQMSCILLQVDRRPLAILQDSAGALYHCRVRASGSLFLGTVLSGVLLSKKDGFVIQVLTLESFQGQRRRYSPARTAVMLEQLLSSGSLMMVQPPQLRLEVLPLRPLSDITPGLRGLWLTSEHLFFSWRPQPVFDASWDGGKLLLVQQTKGQLCSLSELLPQVSNRTLRQELELLGTTPRNLKLALTESGELRVLEVQLLKKEPALLPSLQQHSYISLEEFRAALSQPSQKH